MTWISLADRVRLRFPGNMNSQAIALGDCDHDGFHELIVGNMEGHLAVFKYATQSEPWLSWDNLGTITCVTLGDCCNIGRSFLVAITAEGFYHIFDFIGAKRSSTDSDPTVLRWSIPIPVNISRQLIVDYDDDGQKELILGRTDRVLHAFQLQFVSNPDTDTVNSFSNQQQQQVTSPVGATSKQQAPLPPPPTSTRTITASTIPLDQSPSPGIPVLTEKQKWQFNGQLGSLVSIQNDNKTRLLVAQPGLSFYMLSSVHTKNTSPDMKGQEIFKQNEPVAFKMDVVSSSLEHNAGQITTSPTSEPNQKHEQQQQPTHNLSLNESKLFFGHQGEAMEVATELCAGVQGPDGDDVWVVACTMDGQMKWCQPSAPAHNTSNNNNINNYNNGGGVGMKEQMIDLQVKNQLFALGRLDLLTPGVYGHVVACSWNGTTYFVSASKATDNEHELCLNVRQFHFPERVCAFTCGRFSLVPGYPEQPCLFYVDFNDEIFVYYNLEGNIDPIKES